MGFHSAIRADVRRLSTDHFGCAVLAKAIAVSSGEEKLMLARAMVEETETLLILACSKLGHIAVVHAAECLQDQERQKVYEILIKNFGVVQASSFGKLVVARLFS